MNTPTQPTLAEIVGALRKEADNWDRLPDVFGTPPEDEMRAYSALLRHAADRLEALAGLAVAVGQDFHNTYTETVRVDGKWLEWFEARERLVK